MKRIKHGTHASVQRWKEQRLLSIPRSVSQKGTYSTYISERNWFQARKFLQRRLPVLVEDTHPFWRNIGASPVGLFPQVQRITLRLQAAVQSLVPSLSHGYGRHASFWRKREGGVGDSAVLPQLGA